MTIEEAYSLLSVFRSSSNDEVKRSYRKLMKMYHPDICDDKEFAERQSKIINEAYSLIGKSRFGNNASDDNPEYKDWIFQYTVSDPWKDLKTTPVNNQGYFTRHFGETGYRNIWNPNLESYDHFKSSFYRDIRITVQKISNGYGAYFDDLIIRVLMEYAAMEYVSYIDALETPERIAEGYLSGVGNCSTYS